MPLAVYFSDPDLDAITMTATYSLNGVVKAIPGEIFTIPSASPFEIIATSTGLIDVGFYTISVTLSDSKLSVPASFTLDVTNASPHEISTPLAVTAPQNKVTSVDLSTYFKDDDGDQMTLTATYSFNGGAATPIPGGIFT